MDGDRAEDSDCTPGSDRLRACPLADGSRGRINPARMLGLLAVGPAWQWVSIVTGSLFLVPAADAMMRQNRTPTEFNPLD